MLVVFGEPLTDELPTSSQTSSRESLGSLATKSGLKPAWTARLDSNSIKQFGKASAFAVGDVLYVDGSSMSDDGWHEAERVATPERLGVDDDGLRHYDSVVDGTFDKKQLIYVKYRAGETPFQRPATRPNCCARACPDGSLSARRIAI